MNTLLVCALLVAVHAQAEGQHLPRRVVLRAPFGNDTALANTTTLSLPSTSSESTPSPIIVPTDELPVTSPSATPTEKDDESPSPPPPPGDDNQPSPPSPDGNAPGTNPKPPGDVGGACDRASVMTYFGSVYPTVTMTVTETYDVTLSAENATMTDTETLITPFSPSACSSTIVPVDPNARGGQAIATILATIEATITRTASTDDAVTDFPTMSVPGNQTWSGAGNRGTPSWEDGPPQSSVASSPGGRPKPFPDANSGTDNGLGPDDSKSTFVEFVPTVVQSTVYAGVPYTSTVMVTKKTPVPVVPRSQDPPVTFKPPPNPDTGSPNAIPGGNTADRRPDNAQPGPNNLGDELNTLIQVPTFDPSGFLETVIRSIILAQPTPSRSVTPQTTINNVPIAVRPSSIIVGDSTIPIPTGRGEAVVTQSGAVFTVRPTEIVAGTTTVGFGPLRPQGTISVAPTRITAAPGVVLAVAGSTAVVDGTTFRLDASFSTVITVSGERISIGPSGIGLPSTTIAIGQVTVAPQIVETVGGVTFTIDGSDVFISGTRYGIGSDSPTITTEFNGERVSIGPGGIGFDSTTVSPTSARTSTRSSSIAGSSSTDTADESGDPNDGDSNGSSTLVVFGLPGCMMLVSLLTMLLVW